MVVVDASDTTVHFALVLNYSHEISLYSIVWSRDIVLIRACLSIRSALGQVINLTCFQTEPGYLYLPKVLQLATRTDKGMALGV